MPLLLPHARRNRCALVFDEQQSIPPPTHDIEFAIYFGSPLDWSPTVECHFHVYITDTDPVVGSFRHRGHGSRVDAVALSCRSGEPPSDMFTLWRG